MIACWNSTVRPTLDRLFVRQLNVITSWDANPPPALSRLLKHDQLIVMLVATLTAVTWYIVEPIVVTFDTFAYLTSAKFIAGAPGGSFTYFRPPLLPLLLAGTGVPGHETYFWFIMAQFALGIGSVMVMHDTLRRISKSLGLIGIGIFLATFIAFVHSKSIMTEQIYFFGWCLCINGALVYLRTPSLLRLLQVIIAILILALTRAQGAYVIVAVLPVLIVAQPRRIGLIAIGLAVYLGVISGYGKLHASMARSMQNAEKSIDVSSLGISDSTGKMLFTNAYLDTSKYLGRPTVAPDNGPASRLMFDELTAYFSVSGRMTAMMSDQLYGRFEGRPADLLQTMEREPNGNYWFTIWHALDDRLGAASSDALLMRVTLETALAHPFAMGYVYVRNFVVASFLADSSYVWTHQTFGADWVGPSLAKEMQASGDSSVATPLASILDIFFPAVRFTALLGTMLVAPFVWRSPWRASFICCLALVVYNQATVAFAATAENRYTFYIFPPLLACVMMGLKAHASRPKVKTQRV